MRVHPEGPQSVIKIEDEEPRQRKTVCECFGEMGWIWGQDRQRRLSHDDSKEDQTASQQEQADARNGS